MQIHNLVPVFLLHCLICSEGARILVVIPIPSFSHQVFYRPFWRALSERGHQIVLLTTDPMKNASLTNVKEIDLHGAYKLWRMTEISEEFKDNPYKIMTGATDMMHDIIRYELQLPEVRKLIEDESEHFDLLIVEGLMPDMVAFSYRFKCPFIGVVSLDSTAPFHEAMGNPIHPVLYPDFQLPFVPPLNLLERVASVAFYLIAGFFGTLYVNPRSDANVEKYFGKGYPPITEICSQMSMMFTNTNPVFNTIRPLMPNTVMIGGGTHIDPLKPLPKDIQDFLDSATEGAIYFSLGSNVKSKHIPADMKKVLRSTIEELPYKVLWKFEEDIKDKPNNVKIVRWCAQQDILRHRNVKLFITQGGLQSTEESIMSHVPLIGMPFFMDQQGNVQRIEQKGIGLALNKNNITKDILITAINEVINNPKYKLKTQELSRIALDQPMNGVEKAVWWTEYVIRNKGAKYLKARSIPTYQYFFLDVILVIVSILTLIIYMITKAIKFIIRLLFRYNKMKQH